MLYIRTDANKSIAAGHVMRCLSIAKALREMGEDTTFITSESDAADIIHKNGFKYILIAGAWNDLNLEIAQIQVLINKYKIKKMLIDSYYITNEYLLAIPRTVKIIYIGSIREKFENLSLVINYSSTYDEKFYKLNYRDKGIKTLLGVKYAPLREEFQRLLPIRGGTVVKSVLISTGSTDRDNTTLKIIKKILNICICRNITINVIVGTLNSNYDEINLLKKDYSNIVIDSNVSNMAEVIRKNQIVITASGTTLYEVCACGIPAISFSLVKEQENEGQRFDFDDIVPYAGSFAEKDKINTTLCNIKKILLNYLSSPEKLYERSEKMRDYIDGEGSIRIGKEIIMLWILCFTQLIDSVYNSIGLM